MSNDIGPGADAASQIDKDLLMLLMRIVRYGRKYKSPTPEWMSLQRSIQIADKYLTDNDLHRGLILRGKK